MSENKQKVSRFEFAIMEYADPEKSKEYEPYTKEEETQQRINNLKRQLSKFNPVKNERKQTND